MKIHFSALGLQSTQSGTVVRIYGAEAKNNPLHYAADEVRLNGVRLGTCPDVGELSSSPPPKTKADEKAVRQKLIEIIDTPGKIDTSSADTERKFVPQNRTVVELFEALKGQPGTFREVLNHGTFKVATSDQEALITVWRAPISWLHKISEERLRSKK